MLDPLHITQKHGRWNMLPHPWCVAENSLQIHQGFCLETEFFLKPLISMLNTNETMKIEFSFGCIYCEVIYNQNAFKCVKIT